MYPRIFKVKKDNYEYIDRKVKIASREISTFDADSKYNGLPEIFCLRGALTPNKFRFREKLRDKPFI